jgi:hypothetical protein
MPASLAPNQAAPTAETVDHHPFRSPPLVVDTQILAAVVEIADALAARDSRKRGSEFWHAITKFAGVDTTFLDAGHLNAMLSFTNNANANVRRYAAQAVVQVGGGRSYSLHWQEPLAGTVLSAMNNTDPEVRFGIVPALAKLAKMSPQIRRKAFDCAVGAVKDKDGRIRAGCLDVLTAFGIDQVSSVVGQIQGALHDESPLVRRSACNLLGWLGDDAIGAIDKLIRRVAADEDEEVRRAAAVAIAKINPSGDCLRFCPEDQALRDDLLKFLRDAGAVGRALRRNLERRSPCSSDLMSDSSHRAPPGTEEVFPALTTTERRVLRKIWELGQHEGVAIKVVAEAIGWKQSQDQRRLLDTHLCNMRDKFRELKTPIPFKRKEGKVSWLAR